MIRSKLKFALLAALLALPVPGHTAEDGAGSSVGNAIFRGDVGARAAGLGGAYTSVASGPLSLRYNPAGLSREDQQRIFLQYDESILGINRGEIAFSTDFAGGGLGIGVSYLDFGSIQRTLNQAGATPVGTAEAGDLLVKVAYGREFTDQLSWGLSVGFYRLELDDVDASGAVADIGLMYHPAAVEGLDLGISLRNLGTEAKFIAEDEDLPLALVGGVSYRLNQYFMGVLDVEWVRDMDAHVKGGVEFSPFEMLALRVGYNGRRSELDDGLTVGLGVNVNDLTLDYAYVPFGDFGDEHKISAEYKFGKP